MSAALAADVMAELVREAPAEVRAVARAATLEVRAEELLERQRKTGEDVEALADLVDEVCGDRG